MTDPDRTTESPRTNVRVWILVCVMALIAVGGLAYGLSYPLLQTDDSAHNVGPIASHMRPGHPL